MKSRPGREGGPGRDRVALVTRQDGTRFWVEAEGAEVPCVLRGRLRREQPRASSPVVIGDEVRVSLLPDGTGAIEAVQPRRTELVRLGFAGLPHVIAANLDLLVIVQAAGQPPFKRRLVERFHLMAQTGRMDALLVVNKCDLQPEPTIQEWIEPLQAADLPVLLASTLDGRGIPEVRARLAGRRSVLAGQSGVGKSSLVNSLFPGLELRTATVSAATNKGRHTTTGSRLYPLPGGGYLADTPGIRTLALHEDEDAATGVFPEIAAAAEGCKFRDCTHSHEARCAVRAAVEDGAIHPDRYRSFVRLRDG